MLIWTCWLQAEDGTTWLEGAMDDDSTAENHSAWEKIVEDASEIAHANAGWAMRVAAIEVPFKPVLDAFKVPEIEGEVAEVVE